ncbi:MAG: ABC transporter substrate-binding protein [Propionibacteriaceae bacterium]|jgi:multiple sugar transport system substrate-binding protein|nr:ABC transporter substrate-binding protein [Propionibacteriaceae bacterium]
MKKLVKPIAMIGAAALVAAGVSACGQNTPTDDDQSSGAGATEIVLQTNWTEGGAETIGLHAVLDKFTEETGITINILESGDDLNQVYETALLAGEEADVVLFGLLEKQLDWAKNGAVVPVNDYLDDWGFKDRIPEDAIRDWTDDEGNLRAFPYTGFTWPWWYNMDMLNQVGWDEPPTTDDEMIELTDALRAAGLGTVSIGGSDWSGQKIFLQLLETYMSPEETIDVYENGGLCDNDKAMQGIEQFIKLRDAGVFMDGVEGMTADDGQAAYLTGQAAIAPMGSWVYEATKTDAPDLLETTLLGGLPGPEGAYEPKPIAYRGSTSSGWWISPNGEKKIDAVKQLIQYMYQEDSLTTEMKEGGSVFAVEGGDTSVLTNPLTLQSLTEFPERVSFPVMPDLYIPADVSNPMYRATSLAFTQGNDAQAICQAMDDTYTNAATGA